MTAKIVDPETGEDLGPNQDGMLLDQRPQRDEGYLGRPDMTAEVIRDGWYVTGDIAVIDDDGFIRITGPREPLLEDRRRDGAALEDRGAVAEDHRRRRG